ncbi:hypothetical protein YC2023_070351 [Brassica napus]
MDEFKSIDHSPPHVPSINKQINVIYRFPETVALLLCILNKSSGVAINQLPSF